MGKQWKQWQTLFWGAPKSLQMVTAAMKLKDVYSLEAKLWPNLDSMLSSRDITLPAKNCLSSDSSVMSDFLQPHESQHTSPPCPSPSPGVDSDSRPLSQWCHPAISSSVVSFSSCRQSLPASESFIMSQLFTWGGQSTGASALASFLPKKSQGWSLSEWTGWISLQSKGLSRVFSNTTVQKHQFFSTQLSLWFISQHPYMSTGCNWCC